MKKEAKSRADRVEKTSGSRRDLQFDAAGSSIEDTQVRLRGKMTTFEVRRLGGLNIRVVLKRRKHEQQQ